MDILQDQDGYMYIYIGKCLRKLTLEDVKDLNLVDTIYSNFNIRQFLKSYFNIKN